MLATSPRRIAGVKPKVCTIASWAAAGMPSSAMKTATLSDHQAPGHIGLRHALARPFVVQRQDHGTPRRQGAGAPKGSLCPFLEHDF